MCWMTVSEFKERILAGCWLWLTDMSVITLGDHLWVGFGLYRYCPNHLDSLISLPKLLYIHHVQGAYAQGRVQQSQAQTGVQFSKMVEALVFRQDWLELTYPPQAILLIIAWEPTATITWHHNVFHVSTPFLVQQAICCMLALQGLNLVDDWV